MMMNDADKKKKKHMCNFILPQIGSTKVPGGKKKQTSSYPLYSQVKIKDN